MSSVEKSNSFSDPIELLFKTPPEKFTHTCDNVMDFQIEEGLYSQIINSTETGNIVGLPSNHQGYFEVEVLRRISQEIKQRSKKSIKMYLTYSEPATNYNVGKFLELRQPFYKDSNLILLPIIRKIDKHHPVYKNNINEEMETRSECSKKILAEALEQRGCIIAILFAGNRNESKINPETGKRNGMEEIPKDEVLLKKILRHDVDIVPLSIDGSYKVLDTTNNQPTEEFIQTFLGSPTKLVVVKANEFMSINTRYRDHFKIKRTTEIIHDIAVKIAKNLPPEARGYYGQFV